MSIRKNLYFHNPEAIKYLEEQPNMSHYVEQLILKDMRNNYLTEEKVIELIKKYIGTKPGKEIDKEIESSVRSVLNFEK